MRNLTDRLRTQLDRLTKRQPALAGVSLWDVIAGVVPMPPLHLLDPRHREMVEAVEAAAALPSPVPDRAEARLLAYLDETPVPYGLREIAPDFITGEQP